eukprot:5474615-Ditylum_brightwellii.AAC.1
MECMLAAGKTCCRAKQGYVWTIKLIQAGKLVSCWKMRKLEIRNRQDFAHLQQLAQVLEIDDSPTLQLSDIDRNLTVACKALKKVQQNAATIRDSHLEEMAKVCMKHSNDNLAAAIKNIKHCEEIKLSFHQMKHITKGVTDGVVKELLIKVMSHLDFEHATPYISLDDQDKI